MNALKLTLLAAVSIAAALTLSCGEKCGGKSGKSYNPKTHFCYNDSEIIAKCGGKEYDPETQVCESGAVWGKCAGQGYNPASHFCHAESEIVAKCGGKEYDPEAMLCEDGAVVGKCGDKGYNPETHLCDPRDSVVYRYTTIGTQAWMAENLNFNAPNGARCFNGKAENCDKYGRLYTWTAAMNLPKCGTGSCAGQIKDPHTGICPQGWHVPGRDEWIELLIAAGGVRDPDSWSGSAYDGVGKKLRSKTGWSDGDGKSGNGTDDFGFSALPSSSRDRDGTYGALGYNAHWWSAADYEANSAYTRYTSFKDDKMVESSGNRGDSYAVRCVRDPEGANAGGSDSGKTAGAGSFSDSRDGRKYRTVKVGAQTWMAENLNYMGDKSALCYGNDELNCKKYGALYTWSSAKAVCPSGWLLPSREDWAALAAAAGGDKAAGKKLKAAEGWNGLEGKGGNGTDDLGFAALPGGTGGGGDFGNAGFSGNWWSATENANGSGDALYRSMAFDSDAASELSGGQSAFGSFLFSVRCVRHWGSGAGLPEFKGRFGFADGNGQRLIITGEGDMPRISAPVAVGNGKAGVELKSAARKQSATEDDDGRQTHYNFDNLQGTVYDVSKGTLGGGTYFISESAWFKKALTPLTSTRDTTKNGSPYKPVDAATIKRIEALKGKKAAQSELLGQTRTGAKICLVVFKREKNDMLASLVYVDKDKTISKDFPAEYDAQSTWRVDDGGEFGRNAIDVVFLANTGERIILAFTWSGPEGENAYILREENGVFLETEFGGYRYWAPN
ncbi:MAG: hypothetical protein LBH93_00530 [Chitinispirillales bacterium]|jgi:uncharacterized protein (TIGR02145 family)|nr:hypothetical protein [Chitinispirillales bacterium]